MKVQSMIKGVRHQAGVTILEFIAFIGLAALVIAGALALYQTANSGAKSKEIQEVANGLVATIRSTAASQAKTAAGITTSMITIPSGWTSGTTVNQIKKTAGGITIDWSDATNAFNMTISNIDADTGKGLNGVKIGGINPGCTLSGGTLTCNGIKY